MKNIILIDLTQFKERDEKISVREISQFLVKLGFPTNIKNLALDLHYAKEGITAWGKPFTRLKPWFKAWICKETLKFIAFENKDGKNFTTDFIDVLVGMTPVEPGDVPIFEKTAEYIPYGYDEPEEVVCTTIDDVLDKINNYGIESLNQDELDILNKK